MEFKMKSKIFKRVQWCLFCVLFTIAFYTCDFNTSQPNENLPPNTTLANIPVEGDTLFALVTLYWDGEDEDGYIDYYKYRYTSYYLEPGQTIDQVSPDSVVIHGWVEIPLTTAIVAFDSPSKVNYQIFKVAAVDNSGNVDPTPAEKTFYTYPTSFPETKILIPSADKEQMYAKEEIDEWWPGIPLKYTASDKDGTIIEYAWAVDDGEWQWTTDTLVYIHPNEFTPPLEGLHTVKVISRDNTNLVDPVGDSKRIDIFIPSFEKDIIIIDETKEDATLPDNGWVTDADVDAFYYEIFGGNRGDLSVTQWDYNLRGFPSIKRLKDYKMIVWHSDNYAVGEGIRKNEKLIKQYLQMGGKLFISGYRVLWNYFDDSFYSPMLGLTPPFTFKAGAWNGFVNTYLHINIANVSGILGNLNSISGVGNFSGELIPDSAKVNKVWPFEGKLGHIITMQELGGFTIPICEYHGDDPDVDGMACGLRYYGSVFDLVFLGFPLWHMEYDGAKQLGNQILGSFGF